MEPQKLVNSSFERQAQKEIGARSLMPSRLEKVKGGMKPLRYVENAAFGAEEIVLAI